MDWSLPPRSGHRCPTGLIRASAYLDRFYGLAGTLLAGRPDRRLLTGLDRGPAYLPEIDLDLLCRDWAGAGAAPLRAPHGPGRSEKNQATGQVASRATATWWVQGRGDVARRSRSEEPEDQPGASGTRPKRTVSPNRNLVEADRQDEPPMTIQ